MLTAEGKQLQFKMDTGASLLLVSEETYKEFWPNNIMSSQDTMVNPQNLYRHTTESIGVMHVTVSYGQQSHCYGTDLMHVALAIHAHSCTSDSTLKCGG